MRRELLDIDSALGIVLSGAEALSPETVSLSEALGRFTAEEVKATIDLPPFDNSVMDGYALRAADTTAAGAQPAVLEVVGESRAGTAFAGAVEPGQAVAISTGAPIPDGADAVLPKEVVEVNGTQLSVKDSVQPGHDVRLRGEVISSGKRIMESGTRIGPVELGALASIGQATVSCHRRPTVKLLTSGDELVEPGNPLAPGQIWNSNRFVISAMIERSAGVAVGFGSVPDSHEATVEALGDSLGADLTVICGGVSVGEHDHVRPALEELGVEQLFWGLALKPGRPAWFGRKGGSYVLGVPGNPVSALVVFRFLAVPLLAALAGGPPPSPRRLGHLATAVERLPGRLRAVPCLPPGEDSPDRLVPMPQLGSHDFLSLLGATRLALIEPGSGRAEAGDAVETLPLGGE